MRALIRTRAAGHAVLGVLTIAIAAGPSNGARAWGYPDSTPHDYSGLWVMPFGSGPMMSRMDEHDAPSAERIARELADAPALAKRVGELVNDARALEIANAFRKYPGVDDDVRRILSSRRKS